jgi:hypothetical protein
MKKNKRELLVNDKLTVDGFMMDAICQVSIYKVGSEYDVVLSNARTKKYLGKSTTNHFERFAKEVKEKHLADINPNKINWFDHPESGQSESEDLVVKVLLDWTGKEYDNIRFCGAVQHA